MNDRLQQFANSFIESTRDYVFVRPEDNLLILRPNRVHHLNATATAMLKALYDRQPLDVEAIVAELAERYDVPAERIEEDMEKLLQSLSLVLQGRSGCAPAVKTTPFGSHERKYEYRQINPPGDGPFHLISRIIDGNGTVLLANDHRLVRAVVHGDIDVAVPLLDKGGHLLTSGCHGHQGCARDLIFNGRLPVDLIQLGRKLAYAAPVPQIDHTSGKHS